MTICYSVNMQITLSAHINELKVKIFLIAHETGHCSSIISRS